MLVSIVVLLAYFVRKLSHSSIMPTERTFIAVKPDGVHRGLIGEIIKRFETKGFKLAGMKFMQATEDHLKKHYADLSDKPFFSGLVKYMASGPLVAMCWEGPGIVKTARLMMGETRPVDSKPGTIRGDFCIEVGRNIIHGSDSIESAEKEIELWFSPEELVNWSQATHDWIYEFVGDVGRPLGLQCLNDYLRNKSFLQFYTPSRMDIILYSKMPRKIDGTKYPHVFRWHKQIKSICEEFGLKADFGFMKPKTDNSDYNCLGRNDKPKRSGKAIGSSSNVYIVLLDLKPRNQETDMRELEELVRGVCLEGIEWGASQLSPVASGMKKLSIICNVEDKIASIQDVVQKLAKMEDYISRVDIAAFNRL